MGAYIGYYALLANKAGSTATIHAFEPLAEAARLLATVAGLNRSTILIHQVAVGSRVGNAQLYLPARPVNPIPTVGSTLDPTDRGGPDAERPHVRGVEMTTLDTVFASGSPGRLNLMKLDVENAELDVLLGGQRTIERSRPDIIVEVILGPEPSGAASWLVGHGYRIFDLTPTGPMPVDVGSLRAINNPRRSATHHCGEVLASTKPDAEISTLADQIKRFDWRG